MTAQNPELFEVQREFAHGAEPRRALSVSAVIMAGREGLLWEKMIQDDSFQIDWKPKGYLAGQEIVITISALFSHDGNATVRIRGVLPSDSGRDTSEGADKLKSSEIAKEKDYWSDFAAEFEKEFRRSLKALSAPLPDDEKTLRRYILRRYFGMVANEKSEYKLNLVLFGVLFLYSLIIFILSAKDSGSLTVFSSSAAVKYGGSFNYYIYQGQYFRLLTGPFFHYGFIHFFLNWVYFALFYFWWADRFGVLFWLFFLLSAAVFPFAAEFAILSDSPMVSGGISSMVTALLGLAVVQTSAKLRGGVGVLASLFLLGGLLVWLSGLMADTESPDESLTVSHAGHFAGLVSGVVFGMFISPIKGKRSLFNSHILFGAGFACFVLLFFSGILVSMGSRSAIYKVLEVQENVMRVRDSVMGKLLQYNDSTDEARIIVHRNAAETLRMQIFRLDSLEAFARKKEVKESVRLRKQFLSAEADYFLAMNGYLQGLLSEQELARVRAGRDSLFDVISEP